MSLELPQSGSCYVVFRRDVPESDLPQPHVAAGAQAAAIPLRDWTLRFPAGWGAPERLELSELKPWKDLGLSEEGRAFSGTAVYETTFEAREPGATYTLDLGRVGMIAAVTVNGRPVQTLWAPPYRTDISDYVRPGTNAVVVEVTGSWFNRLVYDAAQEPAARKTWVIRWPSADEPLRESGLLGPVHINVGKEL